MRRRGPTLAGMGAECYGNHAHEGTAGRRLACGGLAEGPPSPAVIAAQAQRRRVSTASNAGGRWRGGLA